MRYPLGSQVNSVGTPTAVDTVWTWATLNADNSAKHCEGCLECMLVAGSVVNSRKTCWERRMPCRTHWQGNNTARRCWYKMQRTHRGGVQHRGFITTATAAAASCQQKTTTLRNLQWIWKWCPNNLLTLLFVAKGCSRKYYYCCCCCCCCCCSRCWWWLNAIV